MFDLIVGSPCGGTISFNKVCNVCVIMNSGKNKNHIPLHVIKKTTVIDFRARNVQKTMTEINEKVFSKQTKMRYFYFHNELSIV